jgi:hypothetical protein
MVSGINIDMIYDFYNKQTEQIEEHTMRLSEYDDFVTNNPHLERYHSPTGLPGLVMVCAWTHQELVRQTQLLKSMSFKG